HVAKQSYQREARDLRYEGLAHGVRLHAFVLDEGDERDKPVSGAYTPEEIAALAAAGDHGAIAPGIRPVLPGRGLYRDSTVVDTHVVVYDPRRGDLDVQFYEAGVGRGAYDDSLDALSGRRVFRFVGAGRGDFEIGRKLAPATRQRLVSTAFEAAPWQGARV